MARTAWTIAALGALGGTAVAGDLDETRAVAGSMSDAITLEHGSNRGVSQNYLVMPDGGELSGQMRFVMSEPALGAEPLRFSDLGLFDLSGRWSLLSKLEVSGSVTLVPKQPSYTTEHPWQSAGLGLRSPLGNKVALSLTGGGGHLLDHGGMWTREALSIEWRKPIMELLDFGITGGVDGISLSAPHEKSAVITELAIGTSALFREPTGHWGAWVGIAYALPVFSQGADPTTGMTVDPQARLDFRIGSVLSVNRQWDLYAELAVIDRGDLSNPATRLPILDGGFDQRQIVMGVTRHLEATTKRPMRGDLALQAE
jgi:hypothetical protein